MNFKKQFCVVLLTTLTFSSYGATVYTHLGQIFTKTEGSLAACMEAKDQLTTKLKSKTIKDFQPLLVTCISLGKESYRLRIDYNAQNYLGIQDFSTAVFEGTKASCEYRISDFTNLFKSYPSEIIEGYCAPVPRFQSKVVDWKINVSFLLSILRSHAVQKFVDRLSFATIRECEDRSNELNMKLSRLNFRTTAICYGTKVPGKNQYTYQSFVYFLHNGRLSVSQMSFYRFDSLNECEQEKTVAIDGFNAEKLSVFEGRCERVTEKSFSFNLGFIKPDLLFFETYDKLIFTTLSECNESRATIKDKFKGMKIKTYYSRCFGDVKKGFELYLLYSR